MELQTIQLQITDHVWVAVGSVIFSVDCSLHFPEKYKFLKYGNKVRRADRADKTRYPTRKIEIPCKYYVFRADYFRV